MSRTTWTPWGGPTATDGMKIGDIIWAEHCDSLVNQGRAAAIGARMNVDAERKRHRLVRRRLLRNWDKDNVTYGRANALLRRVWWSEQWRSVNTLPPRSWTRLGSAEGAYELGWAD